MFTCPWPSSFGGSISKIIRDGSWSRHEADIGRSLFLICDVVGVVVDLLFGRLWLLGRRWVTTVTFTTTTSHATFNTTPCQIRNPGFPAPGPGLIHSALVPRLSAW
jgi:hypothetical protein